MPAPQTARLPEAFRPPINRHMTELDRSFFSKTVSLAAASPTEEKHIGATKQKLTKSKDILDVGMLKPIWPSSASPSGKTMPLRPEILANEKSTWSPTITEIVEAKLAVIQDYELQITYENWSVHDILEAILPEDLHDELPSGYSQVGHVAHVNLRSQYLPYKYLLGQLLFDKVPGIKTVINKVEDVGSHSVYRTFPYEVLAGEDDLDVTVSHNDCIFRFNFGKVYWNSRLNTEHSRIMAKFKEGEVVGDVMAGVGPFAVPSGKRKVFVWANDLNPEGYASLQDAIKTNKVGGFVKASNMDGRDFIRQSAKDLLKNQRTASVIPKPTSRSSRKTAQSAVSNRQPLQVFQEPSTFDHFVMNLPATAVEFLDAFKGVYQGKESQFVPVSERNLPTIHVYLFSAVETDEAEEAKACCAKVSEYLGHLITPDTPEVEVWDVRLVSPKKKQFCVSFRLPPEIAFSK